MNEMPEDHMRRIFEYLGVPVDKQNEVDIYDYNMLSKVSENDEKDMAPCISKERLRPQTLVLFDWNDDYTEKSRTKYRLWYSAEKNTLVIEQ